MGGKLETLHGCYKQTASRSNTGRCLQCEYPICANCVVYWRTCATTKQLSVYFHTIVLHTRCMRNCCRWIPRSFLKVARQTDPQTNQTEHDRDLEPERHSDAQLDIVTDLNRHTNDAISHVHRSKPTSKIVCKQFWLEEDKKYHFLVVLLVYYSIYVLTQMQRRHRQRLYA